MACPDTGSSASTAEARPRQITMSISRHRTPPAAWWRRPFILKHTTARPAAPANLTAAAAGSELPEGDYYATGATSMAKATRMDTADALEDILHDGSAAYLMVSVPPESWERLLKAAGVREPAFASSVPECACNMSSRLEHEAHWRMLLAGGAAATVGMHFHVDALPTSSWQLQLLGAKRWHLCPPTPKGGYCGGSVDDPDAAYSPCGTPAEEEPAAGCLDATVRRGEALYYPEQWWHRTSNAGAAPMVSVSRSLVTPANARAMAAALQLFCRRALAVARDAYAPACLALVPCLRRWAAIADDRVAHAIPAHGSVLGWASEWT